MAHSKNINSCISDFRFTICNVLDIYDRLKQVRTTHTL